MRKEIRLSRIHCAGCAVSLEDKICEVEGVKSAAIDFATKTVKVEVENKNSKEILARVEKTITTFDSSIRIVDTSEEEKLKRREKLHKVADIVKVCVALVLTAVAYFLPAAVEWLKITLFVLAYAAVGYEVLYSAVKNLFRGKMLDENFLMSIATVGALALRQWVEAIAVMLLYSVGEILENLAVDRSRKRVKSLVSIKAEYANRVDEDGEHQVALDMVKVGDILRVKPGEKVPLDVVVLEGESSLNTAAITGESKELFASKGSELLSGYINGEGLLTCKVLRDEKQSAVTKIIELVENATKSKAKTERFITKFAKWYTPIVVGVAALLALVPWLAGANASVWLYRALTFLVVSCPCALVVSIPLSYFAGIGASAKRGVLVKGASYLELLAKVDTVIFDKTGTLTYGDFEVAEICAQPCSDKNEVLELIAYAESFSNHRIARSIVREYKKQINTAWVSGYKEVAGKGVEATLFGEPCLVGNASLLSEHGIEFEPVERGGTVVYLAKSGQYMGYILVADKVKEDSFSVAEALRAQGVKSVTMFTGDNSAVAKEVADSLGLDGYWAELLPAGKVEKLNEIKQSGSTLAFVGDGINDAPVLASVDVGVSMGGVGSDVAIEASDVVLMTDQPTKLTDAIVVAKKTKKIVIENIIFIMAIKVAVLALTACGISGMWLAIFADVGVCLLAVLNSLRAMITKCQKSKKKREEK